MGAHIINGKFQSDKYPTCPAGKVPLSVEDPTAQDLLWELALRTAGYEREGACCLGCGKLLTNDDAEIALCNTCEKDRCEREDGFLRRVPHNEAVDIAIEHTFGVKLPPK